MAAHMHMTLNNVRVNDTTDHIKSAFKVRKWDCPGGPVGKNLPADTGDRGLIPGLGRFHMPWSD